MNVKVYAKDEGARVAIAGFGEATVSRGVEVPEAVARELAKHSGLRVEVPAEGEGKKPAKGAKE